MRSIEEKAKSIFDKLSTNIGVLNSRNIEDAKVSLSQVVGTGIGDGEIFVNIEININEKSSVTLLFVATDDEKDIEERRSKLAYFFMALDYDLIKKLIADNKDTISFASRMGQNIFAAYSLDENMFLGNGIIEKTEPVKH